MSSTLRFAIMVQTNSIKLWQADVIKKLIESNIAKPILLIVNDGFLEEYKSNTSNKHLFYQVYEKFFLRNKYFSNVPFPSELETINTIHCRTEKRGKFSEYFNENDIATINSYKLDFILRFGFSIIRGDILKVAKYGIWSFHHSDEQVVRGGPAGFYEVFNKHKTNGVILQKLTNHLDGGIILKKRFYKTIYHDYAFHIHKVLGASTDMPLQVCIDILNNNAEYFANKPSESKAKIYTTPNNFKMLKFMLNQAYRRVLRFLIEVLVHERWLIGIAEKPIDKYIENGNIKCDKWFFGNSKKEYVADPFAIKVNNGYRIFFEQYYYRKGKAGLSYVDVSDNFEFGKINKLLPDKTHYSFPTIITHQNETYILPEQHQMNNLQLYKLNNEQNTVISTIDLLKNETLVDPVLFYHNNFWWLFGTENGLHSNEKLLIYYSDQIDGTYKPHAQNPVKVNPNGSRMAGPIHFTNEKMLRFAQDSSEYYGKRIVVFEIKHLCTTKYEEMFIKYIVPDKNNKYNKGIHTISSIDNMTLIDSKSHILSWAGSCYKFQRKLKRKF